MSEDSNQNKETKEEEISEFEQMLKLEDDIMEAQEKTIYDININSIEDLIKILSEKGYDFVMMEGQNDGNAKISFQLNNIDKETKLIQYPIYSKILLKIKSATNLNITETETPQEGKGEYVIDGKTFSIFSKTIPNKLGEKIFLSATIGINGGVEKKKKRSIGNLLLFLLGISIISLILGGSFLTFIVLSAKTVDDVKFFYSLGINLNDINSFIIKIVSVIFSIFIFIETIFTIIFFFKFFLTKKENRKKRITSTIAWITFLILIFASLTVWLVIDKKVRSLPNWQELNYGYVQIYDNDKLINKNFEKADALIQDTKSIIGPITLKYDLTYLQKREADNGFKITKYIWDFGDGNNSKVDFLNPLAIHKFVNKGTFNIKLRAEGTNLLTGKVESKEIGEVTPISIVNIVKITESFVNSGGKIVEFDASDITELGNIEWYFGEDFINPIWTGPQFNPGKPIFKETIVAMKIKNESKDNSNNLEKIFIISGESENNIDGNISYQQDLEDELKVNLKVENIKNASGNGFIKNYKWNLGNEVISQDGDINLPEKSSEITFKFRDYGDHIVKVLLTNSVGKTKELTQTITIRKSLVLKDPLKFYNEGKELEVKYVGRKYEYFIDNLGVPTNLKIDASQVTSEDYIYNLKDVKWDLNQDGKIDKIGNSIDYPVDVDGNHTVSVYYTFTHRLIKDRLINIKENIYIAGIKKESQLDLKIEKNSTYAPIIVRFDASKSEVKNENIVKFIYDYGDGVVEERDAINPGHKYIKNGDYTIKLTVVTESGKRYSIEKNLVLTPEPEEAVITSSLKKATVDQGIDFSSSRSKGQINGFFWDFGDGETSVEANPTHSFSKPGKYKVVLRLDLINNNSLTDEIEIEIE